MYKSENQLVTQGERLKKFRNHLVLSRAEMANMVFLKEGSYGGYERGRLDFSMALLNFLITKGVNVHWLLTGDGAMMASDNNNSIIEDGNEELLLKLKEIEERNKDLQRQIDAYKLVLKENLK